MLRTCKALAMTIEEEGMFRGKQVIVIGERDGVAGPAIASCVTASGGSVALVHTDCFV